MKNNLNITFAYDIFNNVPDNIVLCINDNFNIILNEIKKKKCYNIGCSDDWKLEQKKIIYETMECVINCGDKFEYNGKCYDNCIYGYYLDNNNNLKCKSELNQCLSSPNVALARGLCLECNADYYPM